MPLYISVPLNKLEARVLEALIEEFVSRDGTDYGERETSLAERVAAVDHQLHSGDLQLLYEQEAEQWDIVSREQAASLLIN